MSQYTDEILTDLRRSVLGSKQDPFFSSGNIVKALECPDKTKLFLIYGKPDTRRSMDPLEFDEKTSWCFCKKKQSQYEEIYRLSAASNLLIDHHRHKAMLYSELCGPEPTIEHFSDMLLLANKLKLDDVIILLNLHDSGASVPQHFHAQIWPFSYQDNNRKEQNLIGFLLNNIKLDESTSTSLCNQQICIKEVCSPIWGLQIEFSQSPFAPEEIGRMLYNAIHCKVRYESQLNLSYNLYIKSMTPNTIIVLFREAPKEKPFYTSRVFSLIEKTADSETAEKICDSDNAQWRWGWLECLGGLPARDASFADIAKFGVQFWQEVYQYITLNEKYQSAVKARVEAAFSRQEVDL